ncbi:riboflavin synthase [Nannocystis radixulma]|uniref:Riboflavin synthase n=1 Tax=Nannocystis radixulma TaxID=2995305 RepID=A0ABT5BIZ5_9BACT|nr:riboflavin synthase [Nannocystis radixulma]MDC0674082.1 riboflavin synthase [Nannocystis radixulma]
MFTGLVRGVGTVERVIPGAQRRTFVIRYALSEGDRSLGASVAISGVCLTVVASTASEFTVEAAFETLAVTTLGELRPGSRVNLEPALRLGDALGGHLVSGHVDGLARVRSRVARGDAAEMWFDVPAELARYIAVKGSVCVDGVSLTVNAVDPRGFAVGLIPHTLTATTLADLKVGDALNLEVDLLARYVARLLGSEAEAGRAAAPALTREALVRAGYVDAAAGYADNAAAPAVNADSGDRSEAPCPEVPVSKNS